MKHIYPLFLLCLFSGFYSQVNGNAIKLTDNTVRCQFMLTSTGLLPGFCTGSQSPISNNVFDLNEKSAVCSYSRSEILVQPGFVYIPIIIHHIFIGNPLCHYQSVYPPKHISLFLLQHPSCEAICLATGFHLHYHCCLPEQGTKPASTANATSHLLTGIDLVSRAFHYFRCNKLYTPYYQSYINPSFC